MGNGEKIGVWDKGWFPSDSSFIVPTLNIESLADLKVADLVNDKGAWDEEALALYFTEANAALVREMPLSACWPSDMQYWWPAFNGVYSTKF